MEFLTRSGKHAALLMDLLGDTGNAAAWKIGTISNGVGPTVFLTAGLHGDEFEGQCALRTLAVDLTPSDITGRPIIIPSLNYPAARVGQGALPRTARTWTGSFPALLTGR